MIIAKNRAIGCFFRLNELHLSLLFSVSKNGAAKAFCFDWLENKEGGGGGGGSRYKVPPSSFCCWSRLSREFLDFAEGLSTIFAADFHVNCLQLSHRWKFFLANRLRFTPEKYIFGFKRKDWHLKIF